MEDRHNLMAYYRKGDKTLLVVGNYQWDEQEITLPSECKKVLINNYPDMVLMEIQLSCMDIRCWLWS